MSFKIEDRLWQATLLRSMVSIHRISDSDKPFEHSAASNVLFLQKPGPFRCLGPFFMTSGFPDKPSTFLHLYTLRY